MCTLVRIAAGAILLALPARPQSDSSVRQFPTSGERETYGLTVSVTRPELFASGAIDVEVRDASGVLITKTLHPFDLDLSANLKPRAPGPITVTFKATGVSVEQVRAQAHLVPLHLSSGGSAVVAALPNRTWQQAQVIELGQTVFGSSDERPYVPSSTKNAYADLVKGFQWFRFTVPGTEPKLAHFVLETPDRDVPPDLDVFEPSAEGGITPYREGASAYNPEATQNYPGLSPFRTRILHAGKTYYLRVAANHPEYKLRTLIYPVPPYREPQKAVRAGMDYLIALGDAWHANTPRRGAIALRNSMAHVEPQACIACHPTQFTVRGYLTAAQNGYPIDHPAALRFLTERLANNPRPLYGQRDTDWARVIFSARTVASRVPVLLDMTRRLTPAVFDTSDINRGFANYLNLHYGDRKTLADDEADGCTPVVSAFEIGLQSWQTYALMARDLPDDPQWAKRREEVREMIVARNPANIIDLSWKITALATIDRNGYRPETEKLIEQLYAWQTGEGRFPYQFNRSGAASDFITFQAMYALAVAGRRPGNDPRLARIVRYALEKQRPDGSWQGDPVYKGFDTPFRDTQFAVMGLSELYHYSGTLASRAPARIRTGSLDALLADIDSAPSRPGEDLRKQVQGVLAESPWPLARSAAAAYLGTSGDSGPVAALSEALGDRSKIVQRSTAEALRRIAMSRPKEVASALISVLGSGNGRSRWGALRVFAQHFRNLAGDSALLAAVRKELADDALPQNRFQAANALWRWYSWQSQDREKRNTILNALADQLGAEPDQTARRGLMESVYNVLDENGGQMEAWKRAMASRADQQKTQESFHGVVAEQAEIIAQKLESGNRRLRLGLLTSLWDFHVRHMAIPEDNREKVDVILPAFYADYSAGVPRLHEASFNYAPYAETAAFRYGAGNGFYITRLGNDTDLPQLFADSGTGLEKALLKCMEGADQEMTLQVIKAGTVLGEAETPAFTIAMFRLLQHPDQEIRAAIQYVYANNQRGRLTLGSPDRPDPSLLKLLPALLDSRQREALAVALPLLARLPAGSAFTRDSALAWSMEKMLREDQIPVYAGVLRAAAVFPGIADMPLMRSQMLKALSGSDHEAQEAAIELVLARYVTDPGSDLARQFVSAMQGRARAAFIDKLDPNKYALRLTTGSSYGSRTEPLPPDDNLFSSPVVRQTVIESLTSRTTVVREAALDLVHQQPKLQQDPAVHAALSARSGRALPDFDFFVSKVQPILAARGADGKACVVCHASHALFKLRMPVDGHFTAQQSRENYANALKVANVAEPRKSLLLIKPTRPNDSVGDANLYLATHNGGERWAGDEGSPEYQTLLEWIRGAKLRDQ
jgi:hypothetical protein